MKQTIDQIGGRSKSPTQLRFHFPAEFERHEATLLIWPERPGSWGRDPRKAEVSFAEMIRAILLSEDVHLLVSKKAAERVADYFEISEKQLLAEGLAETGFTGHTLNVHILETDDSWARDTGPTWLVSEDRKERLAVNWSFNAWGGTYDGLYATYKDGGVQEYVSNTNTGGIVLDIGVNPFLQFSNQTNRLEALQEIIDKFNGIYYVPYASEMPLIPVYDPSDVLTFVDNQAGAYDVGAITEITYNIGGTMTVQCSGDNPRLTSAQDRFSKTVAGLSKDYNNGQETGAKNFWLLHTENTNALTVGNSKTLVARIDWTQTVDVQRMGFMFTAEATLSATATVKVLITVDDEASYEFEVTEEKAMIGKRVFNSTCGFRVTGRTTHSALVYMTVTDTPTIWSDLV